MNETDTPPVVITPLEKTLLVSFDADQIGQRLIYQIEEGKTNLIHQYGPHSGSAYMEPGDQLFVSLTCYGDPANFLGFRVIDATLVCHPRCYTPATSMGSPFGEDVGSIRVVDFLYDHPRCDSDSKRLCMKAKSKCPLIAGQAAGAWMVAMTLTVQIYRTTAPCQTRVLNFDPEFQVGNGSSNSSGTSPVKYTQDWCAQRAEPFGPAREPTST